MDQLAQSIFAAGAPARDVSFLQLCARGALVFFATLLLLRLGSRRFLAQRNSLDVVLAFILGTMLSRVITDPMPIAGILGVALLLVLLHRLLASVAARSHAVGRWIKGEPVVLVADGRVENPALRRSCVSLHDLDEDLRLTANLERVEDVREARLERNGEISVVRRPRVVTLDVAAGVQTVRIELG